MASLSTLGDRHLGGMYPTGDGADARYSGSSVRVLPENPRNFLWRGQPVALIGASESYGAPATGDLVAYEEVSPVEGALQIAAPPFTEDIAARIVRLPEKRVSTAATTPVAPARALPQTP